MAITLTETAAAEVRRFMNDQKIDPSHMLRMSINGGGCSGLSYSLGFSTEFDPKTDVCYEQFGIKVATTKKMALHLDGTVIDFRSGPTGTGFSIDNPNVPKGGGCPGCGGH